jgi:adenylylsulfate kinase
VATRPHPEALLITGAYGSGKSSVVEEIADRLEDRGLPYAALDLDWLSWADTGPDEWAEHRMLLKNLSAVAANYLEAGVRFFVMARAFRDPAEMESLIAALPLRWWLVRLAVPPEVIARRLRGQAMAGRHPELQELTAQVAQSSLAGIEDRTVSNDRPIAEAASEILAWVDWR